MNQDPEAALVIFQGLADLKVSAALDNFGAGLASMNHFIRLPIDLVKVDRRLIAYLPIPGKQAAILQTIFDLGRMLDVRMLAEGIERKEQLDALLKFGCDLGQGHLFSAAGFAGKDTGVTRERHVGAFNLALNATMAPCHADASQNPSSQGRQEEGCSGARGCF